VARRCRGPGAGDGHVLAQEHLRGLALGLRVVGVGVTGVADAVKIAILLVVGVSETA
jgi:hypothetical protein